MEMAQTNNGNTPKSYSLNMYNDFAPMCIFSESNQGWNHITLTFFMMFACSFFHLYLSICNDFSYRQSCTHLLLWVACIAYLKQKLFKFNVICSLQWKNKVPIEYMLPNFEHVYDHTGQYVLKLLLEYFYQFLKICWCDMM